MDASLEATFSAANIFLNLFSQKLQEKINFPSGVLMQYLIIFLKELKQELSMVKIDFAMSILLTRYLRPGHKGNNPQ